jgi:hypothetical protein
MHVVESRRHLTKHLQHIIQCLTLSDGTCQQVRAAASSTGGTAAAAAASQGMHGLGQAVLLLSVLGSATASCNTSSTRVVECSSRALLLLLPLVMALAFLQLLLQVQVVCCVDVLLLLRLQVKLSRHLKL